MVICMTLLKGTLLSSLPQTQQSLLLIDEQELSNRYKIGVLYCKPGDSTEEDLYNNGEWVIWQPFAASECRCWVSGASH